MRGDKVRKEGKFEIILFQLKGYFKKNTQKLKYMAKSVPTVCLKFQHWGSIDRQTPKTCQSTNLVLSVNPRSKLEPSKKLGWLSRIPKMDLWPPHAHKTLFLSTGDAA